MKIETNKMILVSKYLRYKKLIDKCEYIEQKLSDRELFISTYKKLNTKKGIINIIDELKYDFNCYLELYNNNPNEDYKSVYKQARGLLLLFNDYNNQFKRGLKYAIN